MTPGGGGGSTRVNQSAMTPEFAQKQAVDKIRSGEKSGSRRATEQISKSIPLGSS